MLFSRYATLYKDNEALKEKVFVDAGWYTYTRESVRVAAYHGLICLETYLKRRLDYDYIVAYNMTFTKEELMR